MDKTACGLAEAEQLAASLLAAQAGRLPPDIAIYRRAVARDLAQVPADRARAAVARLAVLGFLPSRAEIALACASADAFRPPRS
ncbi:MAG: hypothetical protein AB7D00_02845 [Rhodospirillaceae bacterium]